MPTDTVMVWTRGAMTVMLLPTEMFLVFCLLATGGAVWVSRGWALFSRYWQVVQRKMDEELAASAQPDVRVERPQPVRRVNA